MESQVRDEAEKGARRIPFGRYESTVGAEPPANEYLIGRRRERRRLLDLLFTHGKRSAYLVTGQRGSGKTAFVDYCLEEYRQDVYGRFLKSDVGRSIYDRLGLAVVVCLLGILALLLQGLLRFFVVEWRPLPNQNLGYVLAIPILLAFWYPIMAARGLLDVAFERREDSTLPRLRPSDGLWSRVLDWVYKWRGAGILVAVVSAAVLFKPLRAAVTNPRAFLSYLVASTVVLGHACAMRPPGASPGRSMPSVAFYARLSLVVVLASMLVLGYAARPLPHEWLTAHLPVKRKWDDHQLELVALMATGVGVAADFAGRFLGRPSRLDDWAGQEQRPPLFIRERMILSFKAFSLLSVSAYLMVEPLHAAVRRFLGDDSVTRQPGSLTSEAIVLGLVVVLFISLARLEYNWIVRHHLRTKAGIALDRRRADAGEAPLEGYSRRLVRHTSFAFLYTSWLPVLVVRVNLGVETLDHRRIIEAMLAGLRDAYERAFLHWRSALANAGRALRLMVLVTATTLAGDHFFASNVPVERMCDSKCAYRPKVNELLCLAGTKGYSVSAALQFQLLPTRGEQSLWKDPCTAGPQGKPRMIRRTTIAQIVLPTSIQELGAGSNEKHRHIIDLRLYHVLLFVILLIIARLVERKWPVFAYRTTLRDIDDALTSLSSRLKEEGGVDIKLGAQTVTLGSRRGKETDPLDPRTVELMFLKLLRQIDEAALHLPFVAGAHVSVPVPEVFFVFDELDKLGTRRAPLPSTPGSDEGPAVAIDQERERSALLKNLFSDLKNILSSAPARFIFVGGRNLHDEWLADQTSRQPLLTRLFVAEIYVPTLLTDRPTEEISSGVELYLRAQARRAKALYEAWMAARVFRWLRHSPRERAAPAFVTEEALENVPLPSILDPSGRLTRGAIERDLVSFLTYRSMGNVKRLKELVEGFIQQVPEGSVEHGSPPVGFTHTLVLRSADIHRVQLIAELYRGLLRTFGAAIWRDDKLAPAVFYVADFLLKFHRRAFTWTNLERIDELVHVHRAPELRKVLHAIVDSWTGTLLHPIRNGMYDYRFRIETALELRHASRQSDEEMAAMNFTLDEAQDLKDVYRRRLAASSDPATFEFEAVLGELHDLDEEYDLARYRYRRAIRLLDERIAGDLIGTHPAQSVDLEKGSVLNRLLARDERMIRAARLRAHWVVGRLRLMLQIALTHERTRDFESAALEYRNARALAEVLMEVAPADEVIRAEALARWEASLGKPESARIVQAAGRSSTHLLTGGAGSAEETLELLKDHYELLKHLNLLFQPVFAEAWVGEKEGTLIDASVALVERAITWARAWMPFVNMPLAPEKLPSGPVDVRHALFALTAAELHDKAGDLLFFKGKAIGPGSLPGYLDRAHFHYARSLHDVRRYSKYRVDSSGKKFGANPDDKEAPATFGKRASPDFVLQIAAGALADLAECMLARCSLHATIAMQGSALRSSSSDVVLGAAQSDGWTGAVPKMVDAVLDWVEGAGDVQAFAREWGRLFVKVNPGDLLAWLGHERAEEERVSMPGLHFNTAQEDGARFAASLVLSLAGARALKRDGRLEDAARESLQVTETVTRWLMAARFRRVLDGESKIPDMEWQATLGWIAVYAAEKARLWWRLSRRVPASASSLGGEGGRGGDHDPHIDKLMPRAVGRLLTVLEICFPTGGESAREHTNIKLVRQRILELFQSAGGDVRDPLGWLRQSVDENPYPMTHRLYGAKILVDVTSLDLHGSPRGEDVRTWWSDVEGLSRTDAEYQGRERFTHSDLGLTLGLACVVARELRSSGAIAVPGPDDVARVRTEAIEHLDRAEESFTLRRAYQAGIVNLYYLHDDFNDRRLHYNRAAEMAASELISDMLTRLRKDAREDARSAS